MVPKQRKSGQFGGDGHRGNFRTARNRGGNVKPPGKIPCMPMLILLAGIPAGIYGIVNHII